MKQVKKYKKLFPLIYFSNGVAIVMALLGQKIFMGDKFNFGIFLLTVLSISWLIQTWFFKVKKLKESQFVDHKWYRKTYKMTPRQLDRFSAYSYKKSTYIKFSIIALAIFHPRGANVVPFVFSVAMIGNFLVTAYLAKIGKLKTPKGIYKMMGNPHKLDLTPVRGGIDTANQLGSGITMGRS